MKITKKEVIARLKLLQNDKDTEHNHIEADKLLCELLITLGFKDVAKEYNQIKKWHA